jgi:hypothetical protein
MFRDLVDGGYCMALETVIRAMLQGNLTNMPETPFVCCNTKHVRVMPHTIRAGTAMKFTTVAG